MPWPVPSAKVIFKRIAASVEQALSILKPEVDPDAISRAARSNHGMISIIERPVALEAREIHDHIAFLGRMYFPDTAEEEFVLRHAAIWGIQPRAATAAIGFVIIEGTHGFSLPQGLELSCAGVMFQTTEAAKISNDGTVRVAVKAKITGLAGNLAAGTSLRTVEPFPDISRIIVDASSLTGGAVAETWQELRQAVLKRIRQPPHGGAGFDYPEWLRTKFDIRAVSVVPDWIGRGSVGIVVAMKDGNAGRPPADAEIEAMLDYIGRPGSAQGVRPVTAHIVIIAAEQKIIPLRIRVRPFNVTTKKAIEEAWAAFILSIGDQSDDFNETPIGATIERSRIIEALSAADGEYAHDLLEPSQNIYLERTQYPVAGPVTFWSSHEPYI